MTETKTESESTNSENLGSTATNRTWHWHSTPHTAHRLELSVLALVESAIAVGIYAWLAWLGWTWHLISAAVVAPLLLLRTEESVQWAFVHLGWMDTFVDYVGQPLFWFSKKRDFIGSIVIIRGIMILYSILFLLISRLLYFALRIAATVTCCCIHPLTTIMTIPSNWWRIVGCTDTMHRPELLPGYFQDPTLKEKYDFSEFDPVDWLRTLKKDDGWRDFIFYAVLITPFFILPTLLFRWSLKGSSIIYLPLLWLVAVALKGDIWDRLANICQVAFFKARRWFALLVILFVASKLFAEPLWQWIAERWPAVTTSPLATIYIASEEIPRWQLVSAVNGLLVWLVFFVADYALAHRENTHGTQVVPIVEGVLRLVWLISGVLTLYTVTILIYNVFTIEWTHLTPIGTKWFPWE